MCWACVYACICACVCVCARMREENKEQTVKINRERMEARKYSGLNIKTCAQKSVV